jgi:hypothetical protein
MSPSTLRILIAAFFIAHGWIHFSLTTVPVPAPGALRTPFWPSWKRTDIDPLWPAARLKLAPAAVRMLGSILWVTALTGFCLAGLGLLVLPGTPILWQSTAVIGSAASLILLALYWHPWLPVGVLIDLAVIAAIAFHWPAALFSH